MDCPLYENNWRFDYRYLNRLFRNYPICWWKWCRIHHFSFLPAFFFSVSKEESFDRKLFAVPWFHSSRFENHPNYFRQNSGAFFGVPESGFLGFSFVRFAPKLPTNSTDCVLSVSWKCTISMPPDWKWYGENTFGFVGKLLMCRCFWNRGNHASKLNINVENLSKQEKTPPY